MNSEIQVKIKEAKEVLKGLGVDRLRQNDRSALTLLALLNLEPNKSWSSATNPYLQTFKIMEFMRVFYEKDYKPNSRETIRRQTLHQFELFRIVDRNRDDPSRPTNSKDNNYSVTTEALEAIKAYGTSSWVKKSQSFQKTIPVRLKQYEQKQSRHNINFKLPSGQEITLSPGAHNQLHADIVKKFIPEFIGNKNAEVLYIGDTASSRSGEGGKLMHCLEQRFEDLNLPSFKHSKLPDLVIYDNKRSWLFLIEAVTSHGPVSTKRYIELDKMFKACDIGLVFVTAFPNTNLFKKNSNDIAWETEVWIADRPKHMIHFNGDRFLGPR